MTGAHADLDRADDAIRHLEAAVGANPEIARRTVRALRGELPMLEAEMTEKQVALRIPGEWLERVGELEPRIAADPTFQAFGAVKRSTVLRLALARGLEVLEAEYPGEAGDSTE